MVFLRGSDPGWLGLYEPTSSPGAYRWLDDTYPEWDKWGAGYPDSSGGCVVMLSDGHWANTDCNNSRHYICLVPSGR